MDKRLRLLLLATVLLVAPAIGFFVPYLSLLFAVTGIFFIPTSLVLTATILYLIRSTWRAQLLLASLALCNLVGALSLIWLFFSL